jgi:hypothetical protein
MIEKFINLLARVIARLILLIMTAIVLGIGAGFLIAIIRYYLIKVN